MIAFKMSVYRNFVQEMGHSLKSVNKERLEEFTFLLISAGLYSGMGCDNDSCYFDASCLLNFSIKKKIQRLEELTHQQHQGVHK